MALSLFDNSDTSQAQATDLVAQALRGADDGELFVEKRETQGFSFDDGKLKAASFDESQGFGLRSVTGETAAYSHSTEISAAALKRAAALCKSMAGTGGQLAASPERTNQKLYSAHNPVEAIGFAEKIGLLQKVDSFARALGPRLRRFRFRWPATGNPLKSSGATAAFTATCGRWCALACPLCRLAAAFRARAAMGWVAVAIPPPIDRGALAGGGARSLPAKPGVTGCKAGAGR